ncbi:MAG: MFS transporter [Planctomycetes bacterium]|nr:MFS transporter [Planctomycetota bacterium]
MTETERPTSVRYYVLALTVCVAVLLYLDRYCLGYITPYVREGMKLTPGETGFMLSAFFLTYAFGQLPGGWLADRYGTRWMLSIYLAIWSVLTGLIGFADGFVLLLILRFGCGLFEAGAYPACAGLIRRWVPYEQRGLASGIVSLGGRIGGAVTPTITMFLMLVFMPVSKPSLVVDADRDILDAKGFARDLLLISDKDPKLAPASAVSTVGLAVSPGSAGPVLAASANFSGITDKRIPPILQDAAPRLGTKLTDSERQLVLVLAGMSEKEETTSDQRERLAAIINRLLGEPDLFDGIDLEPIKGKLTRQALDLLDDSSRRSDADKVTRLNRFLFEVVFPGRVRQLLGDGWPPVLMVYGVIGVALAVVFFWFHRDTPREHFMTNEAEAQLAEATEKAAGDSEPPIPASTLWWSILTDRSLWASSIVQFGTNFGWIVIGNQLALYLFEVHQIPEGVEKSIMVSLPFAVALPTLIIGGWWTDWMTSAYGQRLGRSFPIASTRFATAAAFLGCWFIEGAWPVVILLAVMSFVHDLGLPAIWGYNLDVGKRNVGVVLGWGNMWGNLGGFVSPLVLVPLTSAFSTKKEGYDALFLVCAAVFAFIGVVSLFIDATKVIGEEPTKQPST